MDVFLKGRAKSETYSRWMRSEAGWRTKPFDSPTAATYIASFPEMSGRLRLRLER